jgi:sugar (pentulose or hexulose) kinase
LVIQPLLTGNVTWDWALETFVDANHQRALAKQASLFEESILPPQALVALPWLNRPNPLHPQANGGCCFVGAGPLTSKADLVRAVAAGLSYELARVFKEAKDRRAFDSVILSGGASEGRHFQQIITALFRPLPVYQIMDAPWMGARGCLHPFSAKVLRAKVKRVRTTRRLDSEALRLGQDVYQATFARLYGNVPAGRAFSFHTKRDTR